MPDHVGALLEATVLKKKQDIINYGFIEWTCECGKTTKVAKVGLTYLGELIGVWTCRACHHRNSSKISMAEIIKSMPTQYIDGLEITERVRRLCIIVSAMHNYLSDIRRKAGLE